MENQTKFVKSYIAKFYQDENGVLHTERENSGFNSFEILGMLETTKLQLLDLMTGNIEIPIQNTKLAIIEDNRLTISDVIKNEQMSVRLTNALIGYAKLYNVEYLDEVDENKMVKKLRNVGNITKFELRHLKEKLNIK